MAPTSNRHPVVSRTSNCATTSDGRRWCRVSTVKYATGDRYGYDCGDHIREMSWRDIMERDPTQRAPVKQPGVSKKPKLPLMKSWWHDPKHKRHR